MTFLTVALELFLSWLELFISPIKNTNLLWILAPIWISWFFTEFFQEKEGTHFGNAITNGAIPIWVGIDWSRYLTTQLTAKILIEDIIIKFVLCGIIVLYGIFVIAQGLKAKGFAHFGGRIRVITYILVMFTPIVYGVVQFSWMLLLGILVFSPVFYFFIELIAKITPDSKALKVDMGEHKDSATDPFSSASTKDPFASSLPSQQPSMNDPFANPNVGMPNQNYSMGQQQSIPQPMQQNNPYGTGSSQVPAQPLQPAQNPQFDGLPAFPNPRFNSR